MTETIALASDHAAVELKALLAAWLGELGYSLLDLGPATADRVDYPDYGYKLAEAIEAGRAAKGIALCGSGIGISIAVNRHPACRCARVTDGLSARLAREHNDANVVAIGARLTGVDAAKDIVQQFLNTSFEGGRHAARIEKLTSPRFEETVR